MSHYEDRTYAKAASMQNTVGLGQAQLGNALVEREKEIPARLSTLSYELNALQDAIDNLNSRLQPVIAPRPANPLCKKDAVPSATGIGSALFEATERIRFFTDRLRSITGELEI